MLRLGMGVDQNYRGIEGFLRKLIGNSRHLWLWDEATLREELLQVGYQEIQSVVYGDSGDAMFDMIELPVPWDFSLGTQALKPA